MRLLLVNSPYRLRYSGVLLGSCHSRLTFSSAVPTRPRRAGQRFFFFFFASSRAYASAAAAQFTEETVRVPVGGNGSVCLR